MASQLRRQGLPSSTRSVGDTGGRIDGRHCELTSHGSYSHGHGYHVSDRIGSGVHCQRVFRLWRDTKLIPDDSKLCQRAARASRIRKQIAPLGRGSTRSSGGAVRCGAQYLPRGATGQRRHCVLASRGIEGLYESGGGCQRRHGRRHGRVPVLARDRCCCCQCAGDGCTSRRAKSHEA